MKWDVMKSPRARAAVRLALDEDLASVERVKSSPWCDATSVALVDPKAVAEGEIYAKGKGCVVAGATVARAVFKAVDPKITVKILKEDGSLQAKEGETEFTRVPDWFAWERTQVEEQIASGTYSFEDEVEVYSLPRCWRFEALGKGKLSHTPGEGFLLTGEHNGAEYRIRRAPLQTNSLHVEYDYCYIKPFDCVDISTENDSF